MTESRPEWRTGWRIVLRVELRTALRAAWRAESMTEGRFPELVPGPGHPYLAPDGRDPIPENDAPDHHPASGLPLLADFPIRHPPIPGMGRAVIAMASVRRRACDEPGKVAGHANVRPPTDATQSRPCPNKKGARRPLDRSRLRAYFTSLRNCWYWASVCSAVSLPEWIRMRKRKVSDWPALSVKLRAFLDGLPLGNSLAPNGFAAKRP